MENTNVVVEKNANVGMPKKVVGNQAVDTFVTKTGAVEDQDLKSSVEGSAEENTDDKNDSDLVKKIKGSLKSDAAKLERKRKNKEKIAKLLAEIEVIDNDLSQSRNKSRKNFGMKIYSDVIEIFGFSEQEDKLLLEKDFSDFRNTVKKYLKDLAALKEKVDVLKYDCCVPAYERILKNFGLEAEYLTCKNREDYLALYKKLNAKLKEL